MVDEDQKARIAALEGRDPARWAAVDELDRRHTARMKEILAAHGWPGKSLVGDDGAHAAWLLVQHARHDPEFLKYCLALMEKAVMQGQASRADLAYLVDNVRVIQGQPQVYGTAFKQGPDGTLVLEPIGDEAHVDERRKAVGLPPMEEYKKMIREMYQKRELGKSPDGAQ